MTLTIRLGWALLLLCCTQAAIAEDEQLNFSLVSRTPTVFDENRAVRVNQPRVGWPTSDIRRGSEAFLLLNYVVSDDGRVTDPILIESVGGSPFVSRYLDGIQGKWQFNEVRAGGTFNRLYTRFAYMNRRQAASTAFHRRYRIVMKALHNGQVESARSSLDKAIERGGWNLYEQSMLGLMAGRTEAAEDDLAGKLKYYRRALYASTRKILDGIDRIQTLANVLDLQIQLGQRAAAWRTLVALETEKGHQKTLREHEDQVKQLVDDLRNRDSITASATIYNPCDCDAGKPLWPYVPVYRSFAIDGIEDGAIDNIEVRCTRTRYEPDFEPGKVLTMPADSGSCEVFVFGTEGTRFSFIEYRSTEPNDAMVASLYRPGE